jgi:NADH dehydrogenase FAD-containing subunit
VEPLTSDAHVNYYHAWAEDIDFKRKVVIGVPASKPIYRGRDPTVKQQQRDARPEREAEAIRQYEIKYDKLVIATGCYNQTFNTPGVKENA